MRKGIISVLLLLFSFGAAYAANVSPLPYGINVHQVGNNVLKKVVDAGITWIRTGAHWSAVEIQKGIYDWTQVDRVVNYAHSNGLSILLMIGYTPGWANGNKGINYPPDNVADWENFVRLTVNRYKSQVKYWGIWNEPNFIDFFALGKDVYVEKVFLPAARVIRDTDPAAFIVGPGLAHLVSLNEEWYFWMKYILTQAPEYIDIVSHHIYKNEGVFYIYNLLENGEDFIPSVREIVEETGHGLKPFWITETGWNTREFSENEQADRYLAMLQERQNKSYPDKIFFYEIIDDPTPGIDPWGILRSDLSEKPAYNVYKDFIAGKNTNGGGNGNGNGDDNKKKCFAERVTPGKGGGGRSQVLSHLRDFRAGLKNLSPAAQKLVRLYNDANEEFLHVSLNDSRIYRLGVELIDWADRFVTRHKEDYLNQKLEESTTAKIERLLALLKEKELPASLRDLVAWGERQIGLIKGETLGDYFLHHLNAEIQRLSWDNSRKPPSCLLSTER
jgi:hypothetical protein